MTRTLRRTLPLLGMVAMAAAAPAKADTELRFLSQFVPTQKHFPNEKASLDAVAADQALGINVTTNEYKSLGLKTSDAFSFGKCFCVGTNWLRKRSSVSAFTGAAAAMATMPSSGSVHLIVLVICAVSLMLRDLLVTSSSGHPHLRMLDIPRSHRVCRLI